MKTLRMRRSLWIVAALLVGLQLGCSSSCPLPPDASATQTTWPSITWWHFQTTPSWAKTHLDLKSHHYRSHREQVSFSALRRWCYVCPCFMGFAEFGSLEIFSSVLVGNYIDPRKFVYPLTFIALLCFR